MQPDLRTSFNYDSQNIVADWYTVTDKSQIPDLPWQQVYAIGNLNSQVPLITSLKHAKKNLIYQADVPSQARQLSRLLLAR